MMQMDQQQSQQRMSRLDTVEAGAPQSSSILEQALENVSSDEENINDDNGQGMQRTPATVDGAEFEFDDEDAFFDDLPPIVSDRQQTTSTASQQREHEIVVDSLPKSISAFENQD